MNLIRIKMGDIEKEEILRALHRNKGDRARTAEELGLTISELLNEMRKLNIELPSKPDWMVFE